METASPRSSSPLKPLPLSPSAAALSSPRALSSHSPRAASPVRSSSPAPQPRASRSRREIERYGIAAASAAITKDKASPPKKVAGSGVALGSIDATNDRLTRLDSDSEVLKRLHNILYGSVGKASTRKRQLRVWTGADSEIVRDSIRRLLGLTRSLSLLRDIAGALGIEKSKDRHELEASLAQYLFEPSTAVSKRGVKKATTKKTPKKTSNKTITKKTNDNSSSSSSSSSSSEEEGQKEPPMETEDEQ